MFGSDILDVLVGLAFVYLLASLIVSAATELIAGWLGWRADKLLDGIRNLIDSPGAEVWVRKLYDHPLIQGMSPLPTKAFTILGFKLAPLAPGPSYIPSRTFSAALLGVVQNLQPTIENVVTALQGILNTATNPHTSAADIKRAVFQLAENIPLTSPPSGFDAHIKTDLQSLADKIPDSDVSIGKLTAGVQIIVSRLSEADPTQAGLKRNLQTLVPNAQAFTGRLDQLKNNLQSLINGISDNSAPVLTIKNDLQNLVKSVSGAADSVAVATELVRAFANNVWDRYLTGIIQQIPDGKLKTALATLLQQSEGNLDKFKTAIENWFNDAMDRVSGWYKRHTQWVQIIMGVALTFAINLDSVSIVRALSKDNSGLLKATVAAAEKFTEHTPVTVNPSGSPQPSPTPASGNSEQSAGATPANNTNPAETLHLLDAEFSSLMLPIGWNSGPPAASTNNSDFRQWPGWPWGSPGPLQWLVDWKDIISHHLIGWLLTVIAVSLGAPFWFDLLSKVISIRASGNPPQSQTASNKNSESNNKSRH
jgi:hypothetical protein